MTVSKNSLLTILPVLIMSFGFSACSNEPQVNVGEAGGTSLAVTSAEHAASEGVVQEDNRDGARSREEGEHGERGEGRKSEPGLMRQIRKIPPRPPFSKGGSERG